MLLILGFWKRIVSNRQKNITLRLLVFEKSPFKIKLYLTHPVLIPKKGLALTFTWSNESQYIQYGSRPQSMGEVHVAFFRGVRPTWVLLKLDCFERIFLKFPYGRHWISWRVRILQHALTNLKRWQYWPTRRGRPRCLLVSGVLSTVIFDCLLCIVVVQSYKLSVISLPSKVFSNNKMYLSLSSLNLLGQTHLLKQFLVVLTNPLFLVVARNIVPHLQNIVWINVRTKLKLVIHVID